MKKLFKKSKSVGFENHVLFIFSTSELTLKELEKLEGAGDCVVEGDKIYLLTEKA